jgi:hypothetical protein
MPLGARAAVELVDLDLEVQLLGAVFGRQALAMQDDPAAFASRKAPGCSPP